MPEKAIITVTKVYKDGKTEVPVEVRNMLNLHKGKDKIAWYALGQMIVIEKRESRELFQAV